MSSFNWPCPMGHVAGKQLSEAESQLVCYPNRKTMVSNESPLIVLKNESRKTLRATFTFYRVLNEWGTCTTYDGISSRDRF